MVHIMQLIIKNAPNLIMVPFQCRVHIKSTLQHKLYVSRVVSGSVWAPRYIYLSTIHVLQNQLNSSHSVDKKCGNTANWETSRVFLKSGGKSAFNYAIRTPEFGLNSKNLHLIPLNCIKNHENAPIIIRSASNLIKNASFFSENVSI